jgi:4-amino-4-deoxy-L-arabinose transferase-like glycosyltransferase
LIALRLEKLALPGILFLSTVLRVFWNDIARYSSADEKIYADYSRYLLTHPYSELVKDYLGDPGRWIYPDPLRWGYFLLTATACRLRGVCDERTIAWLSTVAGVISVWLVYELGKRLISQRAGLYAAALMATSPLHLALGRRALQDEVFGAAILLALLALLPILTDDQPASPRRLSAAVAALVLAFSIKPTFVLFYPPLVILFVVAVRRRGWRRTDLLVLLAPPLVTLIGFLLHARSLDGFFGVVNALSGATAHQYVKQYQNGPPHRVLFDLFALAPLTCLLAAAALALIARRPDEAEPGTRLLSLFTVAVVLVFAAISSKNLRYAVALDSCARLLGAWALLAFFRERIAWVVVVVVCASELALFHQVFIAGAVYDPVTDNLLRALEAIP